MTFVSVGEGGGCSAHAGRIEDEAGWQTRLGGRRSHFGHLNDSVKHALFDGFGGNKAGSVRWFHVVSRHGAIGQVEVVIVDG